MMLRLSITLLLVSSIATAQDSIRKPAITLIGKLSGKLTSVTIDAKGGSLKSADGKLELVFAEGTLEKPTVVSIQPVEDLLSGNDLGAYQLEPSGVRFAKPVKVIFHLGQQDIDLFGIAMQQHDGRWWSLNKSITDSIARTISGFIPHFSRWSLFEKLQLRPKKASLRTGASLQLTVYEYSEDSEFLEDIKQPSNTNANFSSDAEFLTPLVETSDADLLTPLKQNYSIQSVTVNGIENGNSEVGTISGKRKRAFNYLAPGAEPENNPVAIMVRLRGVTYHNGVQRMRDLYLNSNIKITGPGYRFTFIHKNFAGCFHTIDSSTCMVRFDAKSAALTDIVNHKPWSDWDPCTKCNHRYTNKETFKANVEIWGMSSSRVIPATKGKPMTEVYIALLPAMGNTPAAEQQCPRQPKVVVPSFPLPADPKYIHFETDGKEIIVHYMGMSGKNEIRKTVKNEETIIRVTKL